jgi:DNA-binding transcriptional LysR family regulator
MDRLDAMEMFVAAVDDGSLAAAARRLGRSPAAVTRAIALLERDLGERLLHRTTRQLRLTERGSRQLATYRHVLAELAQAAVEQDAHRTVRGSLALTAPEFFGRLTVMPVVESFLEHHRSVTARVFLLNRVVDLVDERIDVAVRLAPLPDSRLAALKVGEVRRLTCASPAYLARAGRPKVPADLANHECIGGNENGDRELWPFMLRDGGRPRAHSIQIRTRMALNSAGAMVDAAARGRGICRPLCYQAASHLTNGQLVPLLVEFEPAPTPVHLVFHLHPRPGGAIRAFVDYAAPILRDELARLSAVILRLEQMVREV